MAQKHNNTASTEKMLDSSATDTSIVVIVTIFALFRNGTYGISRAYRYTTPTTDRSLLLKQNRDTPLIYFRSPRLTVTSLSAVSGRGSFIVWLRAWLTFGCYLGYSFSVLR